MSIGDTLYVLSCGRATGRTTAICSAARVIGATVVCASRASAEQIGRQHGVKTVTCESRATIQGTRGPYLFDHYAMEVIVSRMDYDMRQMASDLHKANARADAAEARKPKKRRAKS
jgi:hypothetical protein